MNNIFLAPNGRSIKDTYENFETILKGKSFSFVEPFLNSKEKDILSKRELLKVWGLRESHGSSWIWMEPGDYILYYERDRFSYCAKVITKKNSQELADRLWPTGDCFPYLFFVDNLKEINISLETIRELAGYDSNWFCGKFTPLYSYSRAIKTIIDKFGSVENFIKKYATIEQKVAPQNLFARMYYFLNQHLRI